MRRVIFETGLLLLPCRSNFMQPLHWLLANGSPAGDGFVELLVGENGLHIVKFIERVV
jgi:hypothetical protein